MHRSIKKEAKKAVSGAKFKAYDDFYLNWVIGMVG